MKKLAFFLFAAFSAVFLEGCSNGYPGILIRYSGPPKFVMDNVLHAVPETKVYLAGAAPFYLRAEILGESFDIDPDSAIFDGWHGGFYYAQLPVVVRVFSDKERRNQIGFAENVISIQKAGTNVWTIGRYDVRLFDERLWSKYPPSRDPVPDLRKARKVDIPLIDSELATVVQFINPTSKEALVTEAGPMRSDLVRFGLPPESYGFVKNRKLKVKPFGCLTLSVSMYSYGVSCNESVMYWVNGEASQVVDVTPYQDRGPRAVQYIVR